MAAVNATMNATANFDLNTMNQMYAFTLDPVRTWTTNQAIMFPFLFAVPAEFLALIVDLLIWTLGRPRPELPGPPDEKRPALKFWDYFYIYFNRAIMLPFVALLNVKVIFYSQAVVFNMDDLNWYNGLVSFLIVFALADLVYYTGHRIVHRVRPLYVFIHKHHHQEAHPRRGWMDTCNAHPTDFFYTGISTSPMSVLWLMPKNSVHIVAIATCLYINAFVGALGHCRLDLNWGFFNTRFHAGHHALSYCNFAQNIELWDRLFGTYHELPMDKVTEQQQDKNHVD